MPPALAKPALPTLATVEDVDFRQDPEQRLAGTSELGGIDAVVERLLAEIEIPDLGCADPPEEQWPGRWVNIEDVAMSSGDERDWFTFRMRLTAHVRAMKLFRQGRRRRRKLSSGFDFAQIMWAGDMGASKSVSAAEEAFWWFQRGHPFFHNGGFNFGRIVESTDIYEVIANVPMYSVIAIDEAYTGLESGMSMSTGVRGFAILCAGLRKKGCKLLLLLLPAMARLPSPSPTIVRETTTTPPPPAAWWNSPPVVELPSGVDTVVTVRVTAEDGSHQNYVITIHRASS